MSATGRVLALGQPQHMADIFGVGEVAQPSLPGAQQRPAGSWDSVPGCPTKISTHPGTLWKAWLTFSTLQGGGEAFGDGSQHSALTTSSGLSWLTPCWQPVLTARQGAQIGCWPICRRTDGTACCDPTLGTVLASVHNWLGFWLMPNLRSFRARVGMDKARCQILLWLFKYDHGSRAGLSQYPLLLWMYS